MKSRPCDTSALELFNAIRTVFTMHGVCLSEDMLFTNCRSTCSNERQHRRVTVTLVQANMSVELFLRNEGASVELKNCDTREASALEASAAFVAAKSLVRAIPNAVHKTGYVGDEHYVTALFVNDSEVRLCDCETESGN